MGVIKRQSLKTSIINYIGVFIGVVFFNFIFPHLISSEYLGLIGLIQNLSWVMLSFPALGMGQILLRFYSTWKDNEKRLSGFHSFAFLMMLLGSLVFILIYLIFKEPIIDRYKTQSSLFIPYFYIVIPIVIAQVYIQYLEVYSMVKLRVAVPAFLREIIIRLLQILIIYLFIWKIISEFQFVYAFAAVFLLTCSFLFYYSIKKLDLTFASPSNFWNNNPIRKDELMYGASMLLLTLFLNIQNFIDGIILPSYLGLSVLGIYMRPLVLGQMIQVPYRAISAISYPIIREAMVNHEMDKVNDLNKKLSLNLFLIGCFLFTLLIANTNGIFSLLPIEYSIGKDVLYIIATGRLIDMAFGFNSEILNSSNSYKYIVWFSAISVSLSILLNILLIPKIGMNGAAISVSFSLIFYNLLKSILLYSKFKIHSFSKHYITLSLISIAILFIVSLFPSLTFVQKHMFMNSVINIMFKCSIVAILFLIPTYLFKVSPDLNDFIKLVITGKIFKGGHKMDNL